MKKVIYIFSVLAFTVVFSGFLTSSFKYVVSSPEFNSQYKVNKKGAVVFETDKFKLYISSKNSLKIGSETIIFPVPPFELKHNLEKGDWEYTSAYYKNYYTNEDFSNDRFYVEITCIPYVDGMSFDLNAISLFISENAYQPVKYFSPEGKFRKAATSYSHEAIMSGLKSESDIKGVEPLIKKKANGFALRFDMPVPSPGEDFTLTIDGLLNNGQKIELPLFRYTETTTYSN